MGGQLIDASFQPIFSTKFEERRMDQQKYLPIEMQFYISVMFLGLPDNIHEEKPSFLLSKKTHYGPTDGPTDGRTDGPTDRRTDRPSYRDARTHLKIKRLSQSQNSLSTFQRRYMRSGLHFSC